MLNYSPAVTIKEWQQQHRRRGGEDQEGDDDGGGDLSGGTPGKYFAAADLALEIKVGMTASSSDSASSSSSSASSSPVVSSLSIDDVSGLHSGNYTCAPSNARAAAIVVHVVDGECRLRRCHLMLM